jgi:hypothetical protein
MAFFRFITEETLDHVIRAMTNWSGEFYSTLDADSEGEEGMPDEPSRCGRASVPIPGVLRPVLELSLFGFAVRALYDAGSLPLAMITPSITALHHALSYDRVTWLIRQQGPKTACLTELCLA